MSVLPFVYLGFFSFLFFFFLCVKKACIIKDVLPVGDNGGYTTSCSRVAIICLKNLFWREKKKGFPCMWMLFRVKPYCVILLHFLCTFHQKVSAWSSVRVTGNYDMIASNNNSILITIHYLMFNSDNES